MNTVVTYKAGFLELLNGISSRGIINVKVERHLNTLLTHF